MIELQVCVDIKPFHRQEFLQIAFDVIRKTREEKGCITYQLNNNVEKETSFIILSEWESVDAVENHVASQRFGALLGALKFLSEDYNIILNQVSYAGGGQMVADIRNRLHR